MGILLALRANDGQTGSYVFTFSEDSDDVVQKSASGTLDIPAAGLCPTDGDLTARKGIRPKVELMG
jgi:hypothetical protein